LIKEVNMAERTGEGKRKLLKKKGLEKVPRGKVIHHKRPLSEGGSDTLRNVALIKKTRHRKIHSR
jgi:hypothetical protein